MALTDICLCIALLVGAICMVVATALTIYEFKNINAIDLKTYIEVKKYLKEKKEQLK